MSNEKNQEGKGCGLANRRKCSYYQQLFRKCFQLFPDDLTHCFFKIAIFEICVFPQSIIDEGLIIPSTSLVDLIAEPI